MKVCLPVLSAIALLICLFPSQPLVAAPAQALVQVSGWTTSSRGAEFYRENLTRLRSPLPTQPRISTRKTEAEPLESEPLEAELMSDREDKAATDIPENAVIPENAEEYSAPTPVLVPVPVIENPVVDNFDIDAPATNLPRLSLKNRFSENLTAIRAFQPNWQSAMEAERDPYAIIAAAQQRPNPLKGTNPWQDYSLSASLPRIPPSISPSIAQAELRRQVLQVRERLPRTKISTPEIIKPEAIEQTVRGVTESIKEKLIAALSWIEQTARKATARVEQI